MATISVVGMTYTPKRRDYFKSARSFAIFRCHLIRSDELLITGLFARRNGMHMLAFGALLASDWHYIVAGTRRAIERPF